LIFRLFISSSVAIVVAIIVVIGAGEHLIGGDLQQAQAMLMS